MLSDGNFASLGRDIFAPYEEMMNQGTKVFFYLTENYKKDMFISVCKMELSTNNFGNEYAKTKINVFLYFQMEFTDWD
jgi:hypothetical protein